MLKSSAERSVLGAAPDVAVVDVFFKVSESKNLTAESHEQLKNDPNTISAQEACFDFARIVLYIFATRPKSELQNRILIIKYMSYTMGYVSIVVAKNARGNKYMSYTYHKRVI